MEVVTQRRAMQNLAADLRTKGKRIGFVPTMGYLHAGHMSLVERARKENDIVIVSIFVNPSQFGPDEDLATYPRDFEHDRKLLEPITDYLFYPDEQQMYGDHGDDEDVRFVIGNVANCLCGISRPHHFPGVVQVVTKLFTIVQPDNAYFGQKDYQQTVVVRHLLKDLFYGIDLVVCPIIREADGLAMSSRNVYLSAEERKAAVVLHQALVLAEKLFAKGERDPEVLIGSMSELIEKEPLAVIDYVDIRTAQDLEEITKIEVPVVAAMAVNFGKTRLIDNVLLYP